MHIACTQENLLQGLSLVSHIAGKNPNLPILSHVLLKTDSGNLKLYTTNLEMAVSALVRGRVEQEGEFTVPAKLLQDYIALLPAGKIDLVLTDEGLEIRADGKSTKIKGMPASEFPLIPRLVKEGGYKMDVAAIRQAISQVGFAVSSAESRPELTGVVCAFRSESAPESVVLAATDSYRLSERVVSLVGGSDVRATKCILPARAIMEVGRVLSSYKDEVGMPELVEWSIADNQFVLTYGNVELISRLIEGSFPDYHQIIPRQFQASVIVSRSEFAKAIRAASLFSRQGLFDVHIALGDVGVMEVFSADTGTGAHKTTLAVESENWSAQKITMNFKYLSDGLNAMPSDRVRLQIVDAMNPLVMTPVEDEKTRTGFLYIVMPIRQ